MAKEAGGESATLYKFALSLCFAVCSVGNGIIEIPPYRRTLDSPPRVRCVVKKISFYLSQLRAESESFNSFPPFHPKGKFWTSQRHSQLPVQYGTGIPVALW